MNPRTDRLLSTHGNDTQEVKKKNKNIVAFIQRLGCDINFVAHMTIVQNVPIGSYGQCFDNVQHLVKKHGGKRLCGWQLFENQFLIEAEAHAVWVPPNSNMYVNVTPSNSGEEYAQKLSKTLFVPCTNVQTTVDNGLFSGGVIKNVVYWK